jgi:hypothetical protein
MTKTQLIEMLTHCLKEAYEESNAGYLETDETTRWPDWRDAIKAAEQKLEKERSAAYIVHVKETWLAKYRVKLQDPPADPAKLRQALMGILCTGYGEVDTLHTAFCKYDEILNIETKE